MRRPSSSTSPESGTRLSGETQQGQKLDCHAYTRKCSQTLQEETIRDHRELNEGARTVFWVLACIGLVVLPIAWAWYGLTLYEEEFEQGKAITAGTTMEGTASIFGLFPLVIAHLIGAGLLLYNGWRGWGTRGVWFGVIALVIASFAGLIVAQMLFGGGLFNMGMKRYDQDLHRQ